MEGIGQQQKTESYKEYPNKEIFAPMKGFDRMLYVRLLVISVLMFFIPALSLAVTDGIVARVGDVLITTFEVERHATRIMPFNVSYHGTVTEDKKEEISEKALSDLILRAYKICYANSINLEIPTAQIDKRIDRIKEKLKTPEAFEGAVSKETVEGLRASIRRGLLARTVEDVAISSKVIVSDDELLSYYEQNKNKYFKPKQYRASHILIKVDPSATEDVRKELRKKAGDLLDKAIEGEDFYNLAYYNSDDETSYVGGDIGMFHEGQVPKVIEEALSKIRVGEITDVVETLHGFNVLKLTQVIEPKQMTFEEVGPKIRTMLESEIRDTLYEEWMENLKIVHKVERFDS